MCWYDELVRSGVDRRGAPASRMNCGPWPGSPWVRRGSRRGYESG